MIGQPNYEACDDGSGSMTAAATACVSNCGNGQVDAGEQCDDGNQDNTDACLNSCQSAACGDGVTRTDVEAGQAGYEACDDANEENADACLNDCTAASCGDAPADGPSAGSRRL